MFRARSLITLDKVKKKKRSFSYMKHWKSSLKSLKGSDASLMKKTEYLTSLISLADL